MAYDVPVDLPEGFTPHNAIQPGPMLHAADYWYLTVYGKAAGATEYRQHVLRWKPHERATIVPIPAPTNARGSIGVHAHGAALFSWQDLKLRCQEIDGFLPAPLDARVGDLLTEVMGLLALSAELVQRVTDLETALVNATAPAISQEDRAALEWVEKVRALG